MAVRLRQQSSAWMAPHALAAQLTAQTGQIAASGPQSLLAGIASGVGAFTQGRDKRRAEAKDDARYQDSLGFRKEEMALRKQAADREDLEGRYNITTMALKGTDMEIQLWQAAHPGEAVPPELMQKKSQFMSAMQAIAAGRMQGVPTVQQRAGGGVPGGQPGTPMPEAPVRTVPMSQSMDDVARARTRPTSGPMDESLTQAALSPDLFAASGGGGDPLPGVPSSGDPETDKFVDTITKLEGAVKRLTADRDAAKSAGTAHSRTITLLDEANARLLAAKGNFSAYAESRKQKAAAQEVSTRQAADDARRVSEEKRQVDEWNAAHPDRKITSTREIGPQYADRRLDQTQDFKRETIAKMEGRAKWQAEFRRQAALELEAVRAANKEPAAQAAAIEAKKRDQKGRMASAKDRYDTLRKMYDDGKEVGVEFYGDSDTPGAWDLYEAEREKYFAMTEATQDSAPMAAPAGSPGPAGPDPKAAASAELKALPPQEQTPEKWAEIKAKYGIK